MTRYPDSNLRGGKALLLTARGGSAIAVVRLAGPGVAEFLSRYFSKPVAVGRCVHGLLRDRKDRVLDDPVAARVSDQVVDLNLHGGPWIVHQALELARQDGFAVEAVLPDVPPAEAVDRSFDGDALSESSIAAAVMTHLPLARTELAVRTLLAQARAWADWRALPAEPGRRAARDILEDQALRRLLYPPHVALVGEPNVGKSTLANQLFAQDRSIVADVPGTTRDWVGELANINDLAVMLIDTPGRRESEDAIEQTAIRRSDEVIRRADLIVVVLDASKPLPNPKETVSFSTPTLCVANKQDRRVWEADRIDAVPVTATTGEGVDGLRQRIAQYFGCEALDPNRPRWWTRGQEENLRRL